jgi:hypothetical protein
MADIITTVTTPSDTYDLMTLDEIKLKLGIMATGLSDELLQTLVTAYSDVIATLCNRVFAKETLTETWRGIDDNRLFLSHYPIATPDDIASIECPRGSTMDPSGYEIELRSGKIELYATQAEPIVVTYTGGYALPTDAPPALKEALGIMIREERMAALRASTGGVRSLAHKESRVVYFDPNLLLKQQLAGGMSGVSVMLNNLLMHYVRLQV